MLKHNTVFLVGIASVLALFGAGCVRVAPRITQSSTPAPAPQAELANTSAPTESVIAYVHLEDGGEARLTRDGETVSAIENAELSGGDRVVVTSGTVDLLYPDAGQSQLSNGADVTLVSDPGAHGLFAEVQLTAGSIWTRFERLLDSNEHFSVEANGVVATVRGTAFGVAVHGANADVQVADHVVEVTSQDAENMPHQLIRLAAGQGVTIGRAIFQTASIATLQTYVRVLTEAEKQTSGFLFAQRAVDLRALQRPLAPVNVFRVAPVLNPVLETRLQSIQQIESIRAGFITPTRSILPQDIAPTTTSPSVSGPTF